MSIPAFPPGLAHALAVVRDPAAHAADTNRRILAWAILKCARGQTVRQLVLRRLARGGRPA